MPVRKLNVLVYTGPGASTESVRHCTFTLRQLLTPNYAVIPITEAILLKEPWASTCALLVFPGGADLGYCKALNGEGNRRISEYLRRGGSYLGFCAGGYYGSGRCEFEFGDPLLEVIGRRELAFFPGTCRGAAFKGFDYKSEKGAKAIKLRVAKDLFADDVPQRITSYFNGGGVFADAKSFGPSKVQVLAEYEDELDVDGGDGKAAVVLCNVGQGKAALIGPHPEFAAINLDPKTDLPGYKDLIARLAEDDRARIAFVKACLEKLGLQPNDAAVTVPELSDLHLTSANNADVVELLYAWNPILEKEDGAEFIKGEADVFRIETVQEALNMSEIKDSLPHDDHPQDKTESSLVKKIIVHESGLPSSKETPRWNFKRFYVNLRRYQLMEKDANTWGTTLMYGEVVTSTVTLLEQNPKLLSKLPHGFTLAATTQTAGRGRGANVWIAPPGMLIFSTIINHPAHLAASRPIIFIQYITAIAIVEAIQSYDQGYEKLPVKIKWPNDICDSGEYVKIGGFLTQCSYFDGAYQVILGIGINTINSRPTTSIKDLLPEGAPPVHVETLLARVLTRLEALHAQWIREGFTAEMETRYYRSWLHTGQLVTLEQYGGANARVLGITRDWGLLRVEEIDGRGRGTGKMWALQSDENSFDYWRGLMRRKL
ncbi:biotin-protein ligase [Emericellopsis atlantica]|uniref:Biotin-protein ligase n=1 Tax=Emericellopsis atlantica TaxID=2614577 RepID=A0A9P7ZM92_9HYPO|nr:biotin-protein ligase [Emericellopsis atlantica]KAG9254723.1 biotin-protein ligase [Emericellopsis atlantica]